MRRILPLLAAFCLYAAPASACSVEDGYKVPSNFELVQQADVIVLARVATVPVEPGSFGDSETSDWSLTQLEPLRFLKGHAPASELRIMGWRPPPNFAGRPALGSIHETHFSSQIGGCIRQFYEPGEIVVAFFTADTQMAEATGRSVKQMFTPFARVVETVSGDGSIWVQTIEQYLRLQQGDPATLNERMRTMLTDMQAVRTQEAEAIALDLELQLDGKPATPYWKSGTLPVIAMAAVPASKEASLLCIAGSEPAIMVGSEGDPVAITVGAERFVTRTGTPNAQESSMMKTASAKKIYRFEAAADAEEALATSGETVQIVRGEQVLASGLPADALLSWATHCQKIRHDPMPKR